MEQSSFLRKKRSVRSKKVQIDNAFACRTLCSYTGTAMFCGFSFLLVRIVLAVHIDRAHRPLQTQLICFGKAGAQKRIHYHSH